MDSVSKVQRGEVSVEMSTNKVWEKKTSRADPN